MTISKMSLPKSEAISRTLTSTGLDIIEKLEDMESNGVYNVLVPVTDAHGSQDLVQGLAEW